MMQKTWKTIETLAHGYSERTLRELSYEYQNDRVEIIFKNLCVHVLWMKVALALEGLILYLLMDDEPNTSIYLQSIIIKNINDMGHWQIGILTMMIIDFNQLIDRKICMINRAEIF